MSTTTGLDLLAAADLATRELRRTTIPVTAEQWNTFDATVHRLLLEIAGLNAFQVRPGDPSRTAMHLALRSYPHPLHAPAGVPLSPEQAAPFLGRSSTAVRKYVKNGWIPATRENDRVLIDGAYLPGQVDVRPAEPTDPHGLAKASCALGALADLLHQARDDASPILEHRGEIAGATIHVLSIAAVAARHALAHGPLDEVTRPVLIARYAERTIDSLRDVSRRPASLHDVTAVAGDARTGTPVERMQISLHRWVRITHFELDQTIPSVGVIRQIANQGSHVCAVRHAFAVHAGTAPSWPTLPDPGTLHQAADSLRTGEHAWRELTTLTDPSHEFATASRDLYEALHALGTALQHHEQDLDRVSAVNVLDRGLTEVAQLTNATRGLPEIFLNAGVLFAPATALPVNEELVTQRLRRQHVPVNYTDVPDLVRNWVDACAGAHRLGVQIRTTAVRDERRPCAPHHGADSPTIDIGAAGPWCRLP